MGGFYKTKLLDSNKFIVSKGTLPFDPEINVLKIVREVTFKTYFACKGKRT
jgi:hypothetical protein